jgi:hypothetical protein
VKRRQRIQEAFECPHCKQHIKDALLTRYVAVRALSRRRKKPARFSPGRPRRITDEMIDEVRRRRSAGELMADLAREFGISVPAVSRIVNRAGRYANRGSTDTEPSWPSSSIVTGTPSAGPPCKAQRGSR